jgi:D-arabinose 1-dehydrogenase-like Zn-dependent alcohol dehydrogenase
MPTSDSSQNRKVTSTVGFTSASSSTESMASCFEPFRGNRHPGAALFGLTTESISVFPYTELINKEAEIIGVSDHLATELPALIEFACNGKLRFPLETLRVVDLNATQINAALDALQDSIDHVRTVIKVTSD